MKLGSALKRYSGAVIIMWCTDLFLGNGHNRNKKTAAIARQQILNNC
jgi:hypothetical protein